MAALLERPAGARPAGGASGVADRRSPRRARPSRPELGPPPPSTADASFARPPDGIAGPWRGAGCRIRPLGRRPTSSAPCLRPRWLLELEPVRPSLPDRLVGWCGGGDPRDAVRVLFPSRESALAWARRHGLEVDLVEDRPRTARPRPYARSVAAP